MKVEVVAAHREHVGRIAAHVREQDREELQELYGQTPQEVLEYSFRVSRGAWTGLVDGVPVCMFGVVELSREVGRPWMIGTQELDRHAVTFLRRCRGHVEAMKRRYGRLENYVDARSAMAVRWLRWLGFEMKEKVRAGEGAIPCYRFQWEA
jgi:hypothetical protein